MYNHIWNHWMSKRFVQEFMKFISNLLQLSVKPDVFVCNIEKVTRSFTAQIFVLKTFSIKYIYLKCMYNHWYIIAFSCIWFAYHTHIRTYSHTIFKDWVSASLKLVFAAILSDDLIHMCLCYSTFSPLRERLAGITAH